MSHACLNLGWSPEQFWASTPYEFWTVTSAWRDQQERLKKAHDKHR